MAEIVVQRISRAQGVPENKKLQSWVHAARGRDAGAVTLRIVGLRESHRLNLQYRGKDKPTNVLSFRSEAVPGEPQLGDLVICAPVVSREAREQGKALLSHWAHMVVHGCLHLRGHDHENEAEARRMETREIRILKDLGFDNPYQ